jgi:ribosomal 50S subunit-recycling heat shock protein
MRLDNFISDLGIVKRRTVAKELAAGGHIKINDQRAKPAHKVKAGDIIEVSGKYRLKLKVLKVPEGGSIPRGERSKDFEVLFRESHPDLDI